MSRSYTNNKGEKITVSESHLKTAVKIKKELQKSSASRKCSWSVHRNLMLKEGYDDSGVNESYRCLIKNYQKELGQLPEVTKYSEMVSEGKLESIKELVGELSFEKRDNQNVLRELNKVKREVIDFSLIAEQIRTSFDKHDWSNTQFEYEEIQESNKRMIVCLSDLHIGALVDSDVNTYNYTVALERMNKYMNKIIQEVKDNSISDIYLINLGDSIEHTYMHNLSYNCEFTLSEQIVLATDIIIKFIVGLSKFVNITVAGIAGNHDRMEENKNRSLDGDHAIKAINYSIELFIENSKIERVKYEQAKDYGHSIIINGLNVKFVHGDLDSIGDQNLIARHSSIDGINYSLLVMGHYHHHWLKEQGLGKTVVGFGTLKGSDGYSERIRRMTVASQGYIFVDEDGKYDIRKIELQ